MSELCGLRRQRNGWRRPGHGYDGKGCGAASSLSCSPVTTTPLTRLGYLLVSWVGGYYAGIEALGRGLTQTSGMAAFVAATLCVTGGIGMLEWMAANCPAGCAGCCAAGEASPMVDPLSTRPFWSARRSACLITYRRAGARFRPGVSPCAYLLALCTGCQALGIVAGLYRAEHLSPWMLGTAGAAGPAVAGARQPGAGPAPALNERTTSLRPGRRLYPPRRCLSVIHPS